MDVQISENLLQTVQLIPIFNYLNILSDFLFIENYLTEANQTKQIPIVNALYEYFDDHRNIQFMKINLIRSLLEGSDLYGAKENENFDVVFVNAMFDYIISSLVFDKYGNIYGFLVDVFRKAENSQIDHVLKLIKESLQCASFENEYGDRSTLSSLSVRRIYNDIILPLFPQPKKNLSLCSLDYIYAQAGSMFLKPGRINTTYYIDIKNSGSSNQNESSDLFNEYLIIGHVIAKLILTEKPNFDIQKVFALPALTNYIFSFKYLFQFENEAKIISDINFWQSAYTHLYQHKFFPFNKAVDQLRNDYKFKIHTVLSNFRTRTTMAKTFIDFYCNKDNATLETLFFAYLNSPENFKCKNGLTLPNLNKWFVNQIEDFTETYRTYDLQLVLEAFGKSRIDNANVTIKLLLPEDNVENGNFSESRFLSYDVLEFFFPDEKTFDYYALVRENYNVTLINKVDNPQLFREKLGLSDDTVRINRASLILKTLNEDINEFWKNLMEYKSKRLESYLKFLDVRQKQDQRWKSEWWKEFGLSLVPHYPCLLNTHDVYNTAICKSNKMKFFDKFQEDISLKIMQANSQSLLSSLGTTVRSVILENVCGEVVNEFKQVLGKNNLSITNAPNREKILHSICFHMEEPAFQLNFITKPDTSLLEKIIGALREKTASSLTFLQSNLKMIKILKSNNTKSVRTVGEHGRLMFVNTISAGTGYGYKFIFISDNVTEIAQLRTDYELQEEKLVLRIQDSKMGEKKYIKLNNESLKPESMEVMYEVHNQLRSKLVKVPFSGISIYWDDNDRCNINALFLKSKNLNVCQRQWRLIEKVSYEQKAIKFAQINSNLSEPLIRSTLKKYTFPDNETLFYFVKNWTLEENLKEPRWSKVYIIDNPELLNDLRYRLRLEDHDVSEFDGRFRINSIYSHRERRNIEEEQSIENIIKAYNEQKASYSVAFEDYYAIRNFATTGYRRITGDTREAKLMKLALYKLALRQLDDPIEEYELRLFRVERKPVNVIHDVAFKEQVTIQKFTLTSTSMESATRFAVHPANKFVNILYEMVFDGPYLRVKIEQSFKNIEKMVILLPGTEFVVEDLTAVDIEGLGVFLKVKLMFKHSFTGKYEVYKNIMNRIAHIQF